MQIIRKTESVCPKCIEKINANIVEEDEKIYMLKECKGHGKFRIKISDNSTYYKELNDAYFSLCNSNQLNNLKPLFINFHVTSRCNMGCPVCFANANVDNHYDDLSIEFIKDITKKWKNVTISLIGGEPTIREDLPEIIKSIKKSCNTPILFTNGIKIANYNYLKKLKDAGLEEVHLQFDGFDDKVYESLRGRKLAKIKKQALENIKRLNIPITLEMTIATGANTGELKDVLEYAIKNDFVRGIDFKSYCFEGTKKVHYKKTLSSWDIINILEKDTEGRISLKKIVEFQKVMYLFFDFISLRRCFNNLHFFIIRTKKGYKTIDNIFNFHKIQKYLDKAKELRLKNKNLKAYFYLFCNVSPRIISFKALPVIWGALSIFFKQKIFNKISISSAITNNSLALLFGGSCDPHTFDYQTALYCNSQQVTDKDSHTLGYSNILREKRIYAKDINLQL